MKFLFITLFYSPIIFAQVSSQFDQSNTYQYFQPYIELERGEIESLKNQPTSLIDEWDSEDNITEKNYFKDAFGGTTVGNGGYLTVCEVYGGSQKLYSLDFILLNKYNYSHFPKFYSSEQAHEYLSKKVEFYFNKKIQEEFKLFMLSRTTLMQKKYTWINLQTPLLTSPDSGQVWSLSVLPLPRNCHKLLRAVIRVKDKMDNISFYVDQNLLRRIEEESPLQFSMILFHEFLWNYSEKSYDNMSFNYFFHAHESNLSQKDLKSFVRKNFNNLSHLLK